MKIIITIGLPGSGKTYWTENFIEQNPEFYNSNRDNLRFELFGKYNITTSQEKTVTEQQKIRISNALAKGNSVIISDTNLNSKTQDRWNIMAKERNIEIEFKSFLDIPLQLCIDRDLNRSYSVGKDVIMNMYIKYIRPTLYKHDAKKDDTKKAVIFDIDGTLAHITGRSPYDYTKVDTDILDPIISNLMHWYSQNDFKIIFCSGRKSICFNDTKKWLEDKLGVQIDNDKYVLFMRQENDERKDYIVKREMFMDKINEFYNVSAVFDDREWVVHMWRDLGLKCLQVDDGLF